MSNRLRYFVGPRPGRLMARWRRWRRHPGRSSPLTNARRNRVLRHAVERHGYDRAALCGVAEGLRTGYRGLQDLRRINAAVRARLSP